MVDLVYPSPNSGSVNTAKLNELLLTVVEKKTSNLLLMGDFNFPQIDWENEKCNAGEDHPASLFYTTTKDAYLIQNQKEPTRHRVDQKPTLIDLILTNREELVLDIATNAGIGKSDHATLIISLSSNKEKDVFKFTTHLSQR